MHALYFPSTLFSILSLLAAVAGKPAPSRDVGIQKYTRSHSLSDNSTFDPQDGWQTVNITNLQYKYQRSLVNDKHKHHSTVGGVISGALSDLWKGLKGIGLAEEVIITWYTGHDLKSPSCWPNTNWAPSDESFACALTLEGWNDRPKCFEFLELCSCKKKCIFVRVVDTCAGCARGSKHVDLTKAAFEALVDLDVGKTKVKMRRATEPEQWHASLWGPRVTHRHNNTTHKTNQEAS